MQQFLVSADLMQKLFNYLVTRPCNETMNLILEIQKLVPHEESKPLISKETIEETARLDRTGTGPV